MATKFQKQTKVGRFVQTAVSKPQDFIQRATEKTQDFLQNTDFSQVRENIREAKTNIISDAKQGIQKGIDAVGASIVKPVTDTVNKVQQTALIISIVGIIAILLLITGSFFVGRATVRKY